MKKGIFAILALLTVFAMVSCSNPTDPPFPFIPTSYDVTFNANGGTFPDSQSTKVVSVFEGNLVAEPTDATRDNYIVAGWYRSRTGSTLSSPWNFAEDKVTEPVTLYAGWSYVPPGSIVVTLDGNGGVLSSNTFSVPQNGALSALAGITGTRDGYTLSGWNTAADGNGTAYTSTSTAGTTALTLYAQWTPSGSSGGDDDIVEELRLSNGWTAIFKFTLPSGKTWGNYEKLTADYKIADVAQKVRARTFGNFVQSEVDQVRLGVYTPTTGDPVNIAVIASWPSGDTGAWILQNDFAGNTVVSSIFGDKATPAPEDDEWFTVDYGKPGSNAHAQNSNGGNATTGDYWRYKAGRKPADTDTGTFYLGLGLSAAGNDDGQPVAQIKNVVFKGTGSPDVIGVPLYFEKDGVKYRAYNGQLETPDPDTGLNTNTQGGQPGWRIVSGESSITPVPYVALSDITITYNLNYPNSDTGTPPDAITFYPGSRISTAQLAAPALPTTPPASPAGASWAFDGWYTDATEGVKVVDRYQFDISSTIYGRYITINPAVITYNVGGATGTIDNVLVAKGGSLTGAQLGKGTLTNGSKVFGGWYKVDTTAGGFNYKTYTNLVTTSTTFADDATIWAYWYTPASTAVSSTGTIAESITIEGQGGGRIDEEGFIIMVIGGDGGTSYLGGGYDGDTLLTFQLPSSADNSATSTAKITISYDFKEIIPPVLTAAQTDDGWVKDAAYIWKNGYGSWSNSGTAGNPGSYGNFDLDGGEMTRDLKFFEGANKGVAIQINKGDDTSNKQKRAGFVYGIKVTGIKFE
jgi:uncharacterized repeat protein (TIGR02543 family)